MSAELPATSAELRATSAELPAWSEAFEGSGPGEAPSLALPQAIDVDWAYGDRSGRAVRVAVIDSGIDATHPRVGSVEQGVIVEPDRDAPAGVRFIDGPHADVYGHGTACAAIIRSLAPQAELVSVRVLGSNLRTGAFAFAHAVEWCLDHDVNVINLSLSTTNEEYREDFHDLIDRAAFDRVMLVSAMANERKTSIPSEFSGVFSVAAAPGNDFETFWCNPDGPAEWGAPGIDIEVAWSGGGSVTATGNSFAAAVISGHLARILGAHPGLTPWQARTVLAALAANRPTATTPGTA